jgi:hypothetical protein
MKWLLSLLFVIAALASQARSGDKEQLKAAIDKLDKALLAKDSVILKTVLHQKVSYGHSNGWIETKQEVIDDLFNGKLTYQQIEPTAAAQITVSSGTGIVRTTLRVSVVVQGSPLTLKLKVLQAWVQEKGKWKLLGRQSVKVD